MKIKITKDYQNLKAGTVIDDMCNITADVLISKGVAVAMDGPKLTTQKPEPPKDEEKPLNKCNLTELKAIVEKEKIDIGPATTKKDIVAVIESHRKAIAENAEIAEYLAAREICDDTCRYAADDDQCELPDGFECPKAEADQE